MADSPTPIPSRNKTVRSGQLALATVMLWWLSLQQPGLFALGWVALTPFLIALSSIPSLRGRFWFGWRSGIVVFAAINWWIIPAIVKGGGLIGVGPIVGFFLGCLSIALIGVIHGASLAVLAALWRPEASIFRKAPLALPLVAALWWWCFEVLRASGPLAHSWGAPALSQWRDSALWQTAFLIGQHGLSALCVWLAASLALWLHKPYTARIAALWAVPLAVLVTAHAWGVWKLWQFDHGDPARERLISVLLVQTDVPSLRKNQESGESHFDQARRLTREFWSAGGKVDVVVWPETTATVGGTSDDSRRVAALIQEFPGAVLTGANIFDRQKGLANRALLMQLGQNGDISSQASDKIRVVPFGERAPFGDILPLLNSLAPNPPIVPATEVSPLTIGFGEGEMEIGSLICFESCFPEPARELKARGARAFFILTNDEWCAGTTAPWEHAVTGAMRAVENGVPVVQSANGGYSFMVDACGRFQTVSGFGRAQALEVKIPIR